MERSWRESIGRRAFGASKLVAAGMSFGLALVTGLDGVSGPDHFEKIATAMGASILGLIFAKNGFQEMDSGEKQPLFKEIKDIVAFLARTITGPRAKQTVRDFVRDAADGGKLIHDHYFPQIGGKERTISKPISVQRQPPQG